MLLLFSVNACALELKLTLMLSEHAGAYLEYGNALRSKLSNISVALSVIDAETPLPESDLVIAVGMKAATAAARGRPPALLAVLVPKEGFISLLNDFSAQVNAGANSFSAIFLDQPFKRQLDLIAALLPRVDSIGLLYSASPREINAMHMLATARRMELYEQSVNLTSGSSASALYSALQELLYHSEVLLALPDAEIYNASTIRNILLATYRKRVPLIGLSAAYVKAGALAAVYSTPEQIALQSVGIINNFAEKHSLPSAQYAKEFEVSVNEQVARSLGLNIKSESQLRAEIGKAP